MTMALLKHRPMGSRPVQAADFARAMLSRAAQRFEARKAAGAPYAVALEADALHLPLPPGSLDLIVTAFGFRNLANYEAGLREFYCRLKSGGQLGSSSSANLKGPWERPMRCTSGAFYLSSDA